MTKAYLATVRPKNRLTCTYLVSILYFYYPWNKIPFRIKVTQWSNFSWGLKEKELRGFIIKELATYWSTKRVLTNPRDSSEIALFEFQKEKS